MENLNDSIKNLLADIVDAALKTTSSIFWGVVGIGVLIVASTALILILAFYPFVFINWKLKK